MAGKEVMLSTKEPQATASEPSEPADANVPQEIEKESSSRSPYSTLDQLKSKVGRSQQIHEGSSSGRSPYSTLDELKSKVGRSQQIHEGSSSGSPQITLDDIKSKVGYMKQEKSQTEKSRFQLPKVTEMLGAELRGPDEYYVPKFISLGPYHHGEEYLQRGEKLKLKLAAAYILETRQTVDHIYEVIRDCIEDLKECYDDSSTNNYSNEEFAVMMLVDGCSLLYYIFCACIGWFEEDFNIRYQDLSVLQQDALLLENQLPFELLNKLTFGFPHDLMHVCQKFIRMNKLLPQEKNYRWPLFFKMEQIINRQLQLSRKPVEEFQPCQHLLDLFRRNLLGDERSSPKHTDEERLKSHWKSNLKNVEEAMAGDFLSFRNVKELMAAGIRIKRSHTGHLTDISFHSNGIIGYLSLPPTTIDKSTKAIFFNLIAYEMNSDLPHDFISYLRFLDSLIDHADDVKELQSIGVLQNNLGTHEEVADFFNTVSANLESNFHAYKDVRVRIRKHLQSHYNNKVKMWITQCLDTYFGSPWTIIALVGAIFALYLTAVQTYLSAFPH